MIHLHDSLWTLPFLLYAETHYRFKYFFSYLKKNEPELIADAPHRTEPGQAIPLLILAKDAHLYPGKLHQITVTLTHDHQSPTQLKLLPTAIELREKLWWQVFRIDPLTRAGWVSVDVAMELEIKGTVRTYFNDNHRTSSHQPLRVFVSPDPLPRLGFIRFGDTHTHSNYTDDQVEFGAPMAASRKLAKAMGLSFFCVTDHSYDLDDMTDDFLTNDPALPKWSLCRSEAERMNENSNDFAIVRGEEISCRNAEGRNVHLLLLGNDCFFHGSGDGGEKWFRTRSEHSAREILAEKASGAVAFAAHPIEYVPFLQRLLLERGQWLDKDLQEEQLCGIQFANGMSDKGFWKGYRKWIGNLLSGRRQFIIAGNDAHGNFNRFRQLGIPFFKIKERDHQLFGKMRTGVLADDALTERTILDALKNGRCLISDGPIIKLDVVNSSSEKAEIGGEVRGSHVRILVSAVSSSEFGALDRLKIYRGVVGEKSEKLLLDVTDIGLLKIDREIELTDTSNCHIRAEAFSSPSGSHDGKSHFCMTNPIWVIAD